MSRVHSHIKSFVILIKNGSVKACHKRLVYCLIHVFYYILIIFGFLRNDCILTNLSHVFRLNMSY